jgi:hypothetical protein
MESSECFCVNYIMNMIEGMIASILNTTGTVILNSNTPATDSGYTNGSGIRASDMTQNNQNPTNYLMSTGFYSLLIVLALSMILLGLKKKTSTLKK